MSNSNGRIYIDSPYGVSIADVQQVLGRGTGDLGLLCSDQEWYEHNATYALRRVYKINKWAKFKPVRSNKLGVLTTSDFTQVNWGLSIVPYAEFGTNPATQGTFIHALVNGLLPWNYLPPRGESQSPKEWFRLRDFEGYNRNCVNPVGEVETDVPIEIDGDATITWEVVDVSGITGNLTLGDIVVSGVALTGYYLGLLLVKGSTYNVVTSDTVLGSSEGISIVLSNAYSLAGTWRAYPFFSSVQIPYGVPAQGTTGVFFSAGWDAPYKDITFRLTSESVSIYVYGTWNSAHTAYSYYITAYNETSSAKTVNPNIMLRKNQDPNTEPDSGTNLDAWDFGNITIPANGSYTTEPTPITRNLPDGETYSDSYVYWLGGKAENFSASFAQIEENDDFDPDLEPSL